MVISGKEWEEYRRQGLKRGVRKGDSQGDGKWEKQGKIMQHCTVFAAEKAQRGRGQQK